MTDCGGNNVRKTPIADEIDDPYQVVLRNKSKIIDSTNDSDT